MADQQLAGMIMWMPACLIYGGNGALAWHPHDEVKILIFNRVKTESVAGALHLGATFANELTLISADRALIRCAKQFSVKHRLVA